MLPSWYHLSNLLRWYQEGNNKDLSLEFESWGCHSRLLWHQYKWWQHPNVRPRVVSLGFELKTKVFVVSFLVIDTRTYKAHPNHVKLCTLLIIKVSELIEVIWSLVVIYICRVSKLFFGIKSCVHLCDWILLCMGLINI